MFNFPRKPVPGPPPTAVGITPLPALTIQLQGLRVSFPDTGGATIALMMIVTYPSGTALVLGPSLSSEQVKVHLYDLSCHFQKCLMAFFYHYLMKEAESYTFQRIEKLSLRLPV
jgi:hypothetical protein